MLEVREILSKYNIESRRVFTPLYMHKPYKCENIYPNSLEVFNKSLSLPSSILNSENDIISVCDVISKIL